MTDNYLTYPLHEGHIDHWLIAGPWKRPLASSEASGSSRSKPTQPTVEAAEAPAPSFIAGAAPQHLEAFTVHGATLAWELYRCSEDHLVHLSDTYTLPHALRSWAFVELLIPDARHVTATLSANGPTKIWHNGSWVHKCQQFSHPLPGHTALTLELTAGVNRLLVELDQEAIGATPYLLGIEISNAEGVSLRVPSATDRTTLFQQLETLFDLAALDHELCIGDAIPALRWPADLQDRCAALRISPNVQFLLRLQKPDGRIYAETYGTPRAGDITKTIPARQLLPGRYQLVLMPPPYVFAAERVRVRRTLDIEVLPTPVTTEDPQDYAHRLYAAVHLAMRQELGLLSQLAAMTLNAWSYVKADVIREHVAAASPGAVNRTRDLLALLSIRTHFGDHDDFPTGLASDIDAVLAASATDTSSPTGEVAACLHHVLTLLMQERYGSRDSAALAEIGSHVAAWLFQKGRYGLCTLSDDGDNLDTLVFALSQLADLAENTLVQELAAVLLDKILFTLAINGFQGVGMGGPRGTTAAIGHAVWGAGVANTHLWGVVGLATALTYPVPQIIVEISQDLHRSTSGPTIQREQHRDPDGTWAFDRVSCRTPDFMLTSIASDVGSDAPTAWRASLSATAQVSVNMPAHAGRAAVESLGFWQGDVSQPHIAQWRDALIAHYGPSDAGMGFTHAHFPLSAFDDHIMREGWAFARSGNAYLALTASAPMTLVTEGRGAYRELRASADPTKPTTWLCQLGRASEDEDFDAFQARVLASRVDYDEPETRWVTIRSDTLVLPWHGELTVNGEPQHSVPSVHYATPYCTAGLPAKVMDIQLRDTVLRLNFND